MIPSPKFLIIGGVTPLILFIDFLKVEFFSNFFFFFFFFLIPYLEEKFDGFLVLSFYFNLLNELFALVRILRRLVDVIFIFSSSSMF